MMCHLLQCMRLPVARCSWQYKIYIQSCMASNSVTAGCALIPCFESDHVQEQAVSPVTCQICMGRCSDRNIDALIHTVVASPDFWRPVCCLYAMPVRLPTQGLMITMMSMYACWPLRRVRHCFNVFFYHVVASDPLCCSTLIASNH